VNFPIDFVAEIGQGRRLISLIAEPASKYKTNISGEKKWFTIVHSGDGGLQGETSREGIDVDFSTLVCNQNPKLAEGFKLIVVEGYLVVITGWDWKGREYAIRMW